MGGYYLFIKEHITLVPEEVLVSMLRSRFSISTLEALEAIEDFLESK